MTAGQTEARFLYLRVFVNFQKSVNYFNHECLKSTVIERRQLGRMADIQPPVTFSVSDL